MVPPRLGPSAALPARKIIMSFDAVLLPAEAVREIRARGCTTPGVAELLVRHHGAHKVLSNLHRIEQLLEEIFLEDQVIASEMRDLIERQDSSSVTDFSLSRIV